MKKTLLTIRSKTPEFRMTLAIILASCITLGIAVGWFMTTSSRTTVTSTDQALKPFSVISNNIKEVVLENKLSGNGSSIEIIDAGKQEVLYDETNPYQVNTSTTTPQSTQ